MEFGRGAFLIPSGDFFSTILEPKGEGDRGAQGIGIRADVAGYTDCSRVLQRLRNIIKVLRQHEAGSP